MVFFIILGKDYYLFLLDVRNNLLLKYIDFWYIFYINIYLKSKMLLYNE